MASAYTNQQQRLQEANKLESSPENLPTAFKNNLLGTNEQPYENRPNDYCYGDDDDEDQVQQQESEEKNVLTFSGK